MQGRKPGPARMGPPQGHLGNEGCSLGRRPGWEGAAVPASSGQVDFKEEGEERTWPKGQRALLSLQSLPRYLLLGEGRVKMGESAITPLGPPCDSRPGTQNTLVSSDNLSSSTVRCVVSGLKCPTQLAGQRWLGGTP